MNKKEMNRSAAALSHLAATRLQKLLTDSGHPIDALGRESSLAKVASVSRRSASNLLSGLVPWTLEDIGLLCATFGKSAGYFLDAELDQEIPADIAVVTSVDGGENTVWRAPSGFLDRQRDFPDQPLRYISTSSVGYFASEVRTMLVYEDWTSLAAHTLKPVAKDNYYIIEDINGIAHPMRCVETTEQVGVFASKYTGFSDRLIVPIRQNNNEPPGLHLAGKPIGTIHGC
ncbi:MAG: helix-turn-helix domain-containing protein [Rhodoferax sp.]|nr:helix-turn-helix domain-containing protein [Rhodoferax sp.]